MTSPQTSHEAAAPEPAGSPTLQRDPKETKGLHAGRGTAQTKGCNHLKFQVAVTRRPGARSCSEVSNREFPTVTGDPPPRASMTLPPYRTLARIGNSIGISDDMTVEVARTESGDERQTMPATPPPEIPKLPALRRRDAGADAHDRGQQRRSGRSGRCRWYRRSSCC